MIGWCSSDGSQTENAQREQDTKNSWFVMSVIDSSCR